MADIQRQIEREERKLHKQKKRKIILWTVAGILTFVLVIMYVCEININSVVDRFTDENGNLTLTDGVVNDNFPYTIDSSKNVILTNTNNKLGVLTPTSMTILDAGNGKVEYVFEHGYSNPILDKAGIYTLVYDQGAKGYRLDTTSAEVYQKSTENSILCATVNKRGDVAIAENISAKYCKVTVASDSFKELFSQEFSDGYVIDMALSENGRRLAVATVSSVNASLVANVTVFNINSGEKLSSITLPDGSLADIRYCGSSLYTVGASYVGVIKGDDEYEEVYKADTISVVCFDYAPDGMLVIVHNEFNNSTKNVCAVISSSGKIKEEIDVTGNVKDVSPSSGRITVQTTNKILVFSFSGKEKRTAICNDSVKSICTLGSKTYCHHQTSIEKVEVAN